MRTVPRKPAATPALDLPLAAATAWVAKGVVPPWPAREGRQGG